MKCSKNIKPRDCEIYENKGSCANCSFIVFTGQDNKENYGELGYFNHQYTSRDNKEYCILTILENNQHSTTACGHIGYTNESKYGAFKYCPYCGKPIKL